MMRLITIIKDLLQIRRTVNQVSNINHVYTRNEVKRELVDVRAFLKKQYLYDKANNSTEPGICSELYVEHEVIVSLTSYGKRIHDVPYAIESIMQGTLKPNRIVLWLAEDEFKNKPLPILLQKQQKRGLEIRYCEDIRSYKKIIPALHAFPDACIITIDDDLLFEFDIVEHLVCSYRNHPDCVSASRIHTMKKDEAGTLLGYKDWALLKFSDSIPNMNFLTSGGGTLFPPGCFPKEMMDKESFMSICPSADDVWINAMLRYNSIPIIKSFTNNSAGSDYFEMVNSYETPLCVENMHVENGRNDVQIKAVFGKYNIYGLLS